MSANPTRGASTASSASSESSSSSDSSDSDSSSSSSSGSTSSPVRAAQAIPRGGQDGALARDGAAAPNRPAPQAAGQWRVRQNPTLGFERPDTELIALPRVQLPSQVATMLQRVTGDRQLYPEGRYRTLDYFRAAVEMFVDAVRAEYKHQQQNAAKNGKTMNRFTWKNDGELAVCFACCGDWLKLLYGKLVSSPFKPLADDFVGQMKTMLIGLSRVPVEILPRKTYDTKYLDWEKGGTRYHSAQSSANVRFPSAQDRRMKIEAYLRSSAGYKIESTRVEAARPAAQPTDGAAAPPGSVPVKAAAPAGFGASAAPFVAAFTPAKGPAPARGPAALLPSAPHGPLAMKAAPGARHPPGQAAAKQMPEEMRHLYWLSSLAHVKGGEPGAAFPEDRASALPGLVRLCDLTETLEEIAVLVDVVCSSAESVQAIFERLGGLTAFRRLFSIVVRRASGSGSGYRPVAHFIERVARLRVQQWGAATQRSWRTGLDHKVGDDLSWLRALAVIPAEKRAVWGVLVLVMEEKFIFRLPREEAEEARKRGRLESSAPDTGGAAGCGAIDRMRAAVADNIDIQHWTLPRVYTLSAVRLPAELRAPPMASAAEEDTVKFLNRKRLFANEVQVEWEQRLRSMLEASAASSHGGQVAIPLWYDPFQLLGIDPAG